MTFGPKPLSLELLFLPGFIMWEVDNQQFKAPFTGEAVIMDRVAQPWFGCMGQVTGDGRLCYCCYYFNRHRKRTPQDINSHTNYLSLNGEIF